MVGRTIQVQGFALTDSAESVKLFLERIAGAGTICALKLRHPRNISANSRAFAIVQFQSQESASLVENAAQRQVLKIGRFYLRTRPADRDIVPRPRIPMFSLEDIVLHLGCLVKENILSALFRASNVSVQFGFDMKKIYFYLSYNFTKFKLELSYESIWEMQLHRPPAYRSRTQFLLIQVQAAPKIYKLLPGRPGLMFEDPFFNWFRDDTDEQWTRTIDFTPSASIGQSSILCLEVPQQCELPRIGDYFVYYKEQNLDFECRNGYSYSCGSNLVPIVKSPDYIEVPYEILFKINHLVQNGTLSGPTVDHSFFRHVSPKFEPIDHIKRALLKMTYLKSTCLNPTDWLSVQYSRIRKSRHASQKLSNISLDDGLVYVHRVQVTPAKVYFYGPEINVSNRVVRHFSADIDNFLRISFVDEDCEKLRSADLSPRSTSGNDARRTALYNRVLSVLSNGINIGDKHFEFLAFSSSQLRDNSAWMFASRQGLTASDIRKWMGDFRDIRNVAKYAARLGQSFSSSTETLKVHKSEVERIPDITNGTKYIFSDGVGKISANFAVEVAMKCKLKRFAPSVFQIRYGGYKGVVAVDTRSNHKLSLRKSMSKFQSENITLDVLAYSKYQPCFLNRQLITLLSTLGVSDNVFELKQKEALRQLNRMVTEPQAAREAVELMPMGEVTNVVKELLSCGYQPDHEPYLSMLLQTFRASKLLELKTKSRIFITQGRAMMGCLDETCTLKYGQVFVQASYSADDHRKVVVTGKVVVAKNPCLHPGDIRVLQAVDVPALHHLFDCVVFPQQGPRPHPNECSGSDLDGDIYFVSWDPHLIPSRLVDPMDYTPASAETLDHDVTIEEIQEYFTNYIVNESLGIIANAHVVFADQERMKAESPPCVQLAKLFSIAVDFPKTGVPALIPHELHVKEYPDFMEKLDKVTYESKGVIGKLYREIKKHTPHIKHFTREVARRSYDTDLIVDGYEDYITEAIEFKEEYDFRLGNLMDHYGIKSEAEIISGCILKMAKNFTKSSDADAIRMAVRSLRKEARSWFNEMSTGEDGQDAMEAKASAWYHVTYHQQYWGSYNEGYDRPHLISFPWCVYDKLVAIKQGRNLLTRMDRNLRFR
ncbi:probable RNA-dependent RNA polymerase 1 [Zea mays]|uniref:RNA-dependent RNA polymerase n=1 Tax=Zea mays TaxID=4577 RepID=A0A804PMR1_MAIZE|nr:probable RNA-dependent RNA polymerase 1 [Zea mays]XP_008644241.1 probable RNA-dependent RNA polymerase 1 [Zea mays]XP_008644242.1 probable RNA-dependent RNA polymerase 1 [Zea mays]|eukprot:XP_008644240.1 putative RNA-dependent RNA polymerase isoform X1 [Zea mays]